MFYSGVQFQVFAHNDGQEQQRCYFTLRYFTYLLYLLTYLLTPCSRVLPEKLTGSQLVKKFPAFYGTRRFITTLTSVRPLSLS